MRREREIYTRYLCEYPEHMVCNRSYTNYPVIELCAQTHLTNEMKYAIMCMVVDTVYCVSFMYMPLYALYSPCIVFSMWY